MATKKSVKSKARLSEAVKRQRTIHCFLGLLQLRMYGKATRDELLGRLVNSAEELQMAMQDFPRIFEFLPAPSDLTGAWVKQYTDQLVSNGVCSLVIGTADPVYVVENKALLDKITSIDPEQGNEYLIALLFPSEAGSSLEKLLAAEAGQVILDASVEEDEAPEAPEAPEASEESNVGEDLLYRKPVLPPTINYDEVRVVIREEVQQAVAKLEGVLSVSNTALVETLQVLDARLKPLELLATIELQQKAQGNMLTHLAELLVKVEESTRKLDTVMELRRLTNDMKALAQLTEDVLGKVDK